MANTVNLQVAFNERECWRELISGNRSSLEAIYRSYAKDLYRYGCSLVSNPDLVKDCIQEVFIDIWKYHRNLKDTDNVKFYLFKCLSNKIFKEHKEIDKRNEVAHEHHESTTVYAFENIENKLINLTRAEQTQQRLALAVQELPLRQKEVITCLFFEQFTYEQTSKHMNITLRSVYTLAWKALSSLRESLG